MNQVDICQSIYHMGNVTDPDENSPIDVGHNIYILAVQLARHKKELKEALDRSAHKPGDPIQYYSSRTAQIEVSREGEEEQREQKVWKLGSVIFCWSCRNTHATKRYILLQPLLQLSWKYYSVPACSPQGTEAAAISVGEPEASCEAECSLEPLDTCGAGDKWDQGRSDCKWKIRRLECCHIPHGVFVVTLLHWPSQALH